MGPGQDGEVARFGGEHRLRGVSLTRESRAAAEGRKGEVADAGEGWREERQ